MATTIRASTRPAQAASNSQASVWRRAARSWSDISVTGGGSYHRPAPAPRSNSPHAVPAVRPLPAPRTPGHVPAGYRDRAGHPGLHLLDAAGYDTASATGPAPHARALVRIPVDEAPEQGQPQDPHVEPQRPVAHVEEIVLEPLPQARGAAQAVHLGQAGHPRLHMLPQHVPAPVLAEPRDELRTLRAGADQGHLALEHVEKLRQLVQARPPQPAPDGGDPRVLAPGPLVLEVPPRL